MSYRVVYASNGAKIGDGIRVVRVSENGTKLEVLTDLLRMNFSEVVLRPDPPPPSDFSDDFA